MAEPREPALANRTVAAFRWSALTTLGEVLLSLGILAVLARLLAPRDFGIIAIALVFVGLLHAVGRLGIGPAIIQRADLTQRHIVTGFTLSVVLGVLLAAGLWLAAPATAGFFTEPEVPAILGALSVIFVIIQLGETSRCLLNRQLGFRQLMVARILSQAAGYGLVAITMALLGYGVWSLVGGFVAQQTLFAAAVLAYQPPPFRLGIGRRETLDLLRFGAGFSFCSLLVRVAGQGSRLVIGSGLGAASLGYYVQALRVASAPTRLGLILQRVLFPAMARRQRHTDRLGTLYLHGIEMASLLAVPASILMAMCAPEIVAVLFGKQWDAAIPILQVLAVGVVFHVCNIFNTPTIRALAAVYREAWRRGLHALLVILGVWAGTRWGLAGAAAAIVVAYIVLHLLLSQLTLNLLGLRWPQLLRCHVPALWAGALSGAMLWLAVGLAREAGLPAAAALAIGLAACGTTSAAAIYLAPAFARPRCVSWGLAHLPFTELGIAGRLLRFVFQHLERKPRAPATATRTPPSG